MHKLCTPVRGGQNRPLAPRPQNWHFANFPPGKIKLDGVSPFRYIAVMDSFVIAVGRDKNSFRIVIPSKLIKSMRWGSLSHVLLERLDDNRLIIRRLIDGKALEGSSQGSQPDTD